jgi:hypothetical protein
VAIIPPALRSHDQANLYREGVMSMTLKTALSLAAILSVSGSLLSVPSYAADDKFDIVGLKLGMTRDETIQALTAHGIDPAQIQEQLQTYRYSDGVRTASTEPFLYRITAGKQTRVNGKRNSDSFTIHFSPPPEGRRIVSVQRVVENYSNPLTNAKYRDALREKYGEATEEAVLGHRKWMFGTGTQDCLPKGLPTDRGNILKMVFMPSGSQVQLDQFLNSRVKSLDECANVLKYDVGGSDTRLAKRVSATMVDAQSWVRAELAASKLVEDLRQEAIKKREGRSAKPKL